MPSFNLQAICLLVLLLISSPFGALAMPVSDAVAVRQDPCGDIASFISPVTFDSQGRQHVNLTAFDSEDSTAIAARQGSQPIDLHPFQTDADGEIACYGTILHQCTIRFTDDTCGVSRVILYSSFCKPIAGTVVNMRVGQTILDSILPYTIDIAWPGNQLDPPTFWYAGQHLTQAVIGGTVTGTNPALNGYFVSRIYQFTCTF
ncbi:hypothetical protein BDZ45DRAFT_745643 [Acephala macrosclerotiorum]|nr:hypothetical protein BDZ45DRAFT_745643 [Acephala macrosclerotiorum]